MSVAPAVRLAVLCAAVGPAAVGCVNISAGESRIVETEEKRFTVSGAPTVTLGTFDGSIEVESWDRPEVLVVIEKLAVDQAAADRMEVTATQDGDRIQVEVRSSRRSEGGFNIDIGPHGARLRASVPRQSRIEAHTRDGRVSVRAVEGDLRIRTGDGSIRLEQVNGAVDAASGDGSITIDGRIRTLTTKSGDGRVRVRAEAGSPATGDWTIATGDGAIVLELPDGFGADLDATTGDGRVVVRDLPFERVGGDERRVVRGRIGGGGPRIAIRSGDGGIVIRAVEREPAAQ